MPRPRCRCSPACGSARPGPGDLEAVVRLGLETIRYDAHFGTVIERPGTPAALRHEAGAVLGAPDPWVWLAERAGTPVGLLYAERPELAGGSPPWSRAEPVAYLELMDVLPGERGRGVAAALTTQLHQAADESGVGVTLLHYEQVNPLSGPFWEPAGLPAAVDLLGGQACRDSPLAGQANAGRCRSPAASGRTATGG